MPTGRITPHATCHPEKTHRAHGLCDTCYKRKQRAKGYKPPFHYAKCHSDKKEMAKGLCTKCYKTQYRRAKGAIDFEEHGMTETVEYRTWCRMKERCNNSNRPDYYLYGGRGISVCDEWSKSFMAFYKHIGPKPDPSYSIDRIDVDGNYQPGNVRWTDKYTQARNKRRSVMSGT